MRIVRYWLAGERHIRPVIEDRIREMEPADDPTLSSMSEETV
jgi:hypothetical protein